MSIRGPELKKESLTLALSSLLRQAMGMLTQPLHAFSVDTVAETIYQTLQDAVTQRGKALLAVPGGRSPGPIIERLAARCTPEVLAQLHLFWVDERAVPQGHADRNDAGILAAWDQGGPRPAGVHPMPADEDDLEQAAASYTELLQELGGATGFDVALLGIGEDGHFASCFPGHADLRNEGPVFAIYDSPKPPPKRLSVALPVIAQSKLIVILAFGAEKGERIKSALQTEDPMNPVSLLPGGSCEIHCDEAALAAAQSL